MCAEGEIQFTSTFTTGKSIESEVGRMQNNILVTQTENMDRGDVKLPLRVRIVRRRY